MLLFGFRRDGKDENVHAQQKSGGQARQNPRVNERNRSDLGI
jgi:hypothetical protein